MAMESVDEEKKAVNLCFITNGTGVDSCRMGTTDVIGHALIITKDVEDFVDGCKTILGPDLMTRIWVK